MYTPYILMSTGNHSLGHYVGALEDAVASRSPLVRCECK